MSNLGFQTVYGILNRIDNIYCEYAFLNTKNLKHFDIIAFSVSFENDYVNIYKILTEGGIPPYSSLRNNDYPLIMAGGSACFLNPEPIAPFMDCIVIGEAESFIPEFFYHFKLNEKKDENLLNIAEKLKGFYVPKFYEVIYDKNGTVMEHKPLFPNIPEKIERIFEKDISSFSTHTEILTSETTFSNSFLIELSRGCHHGCRFCAAGYIYRPPRYRSFESIEKAVLKGAEYTDKIGLLGAAVSDFSEIDKLCKNIIKSDIAISCSSLRADSLSSDLLRTLAQKGAKSITIAPDAGSEKMRRVINKGICEKDILSSVKRTVENGIPNIKLYFMIGLPFETSSDIDEIIYLSEKIKEVFLKASRKEKKIGNITISLNPFVPKPSTPFQWSEMESVSSLKNKIRLIKKKLQNIPNVKIKADNPNNAYIQACFARGDRKTSMLIEELYKNDGNLPKTLKRTSINTDSYALRKRSVSEVLPWDFIEHKVKKSFLIKEYECAKEGKISPPCMIKNCHMCGVC